MKLNKGRLKEIKEGMNRTDLAIITITMFLCCFGLVMIYSASSYECSMSADYNYDSFYYLKNQLKYVLLGFAGMAFVYFFIRDDFFGKLAHLAYGGSVLCILLLETKLGVEGNGATRWLGLGPVQFQVAEVVKIGVIIFLAYMVSKYDKMLDKPRLTIYLWAAGGIPAVLLLRISNDLSSGVVVLAITFGISFICTKTWKLHFGAAGGAVAFVALYVRNIAMNMPNPDDLEDVPFRVLRIAAWLDPEKYASGSGYQVLQSLYAVGSGGFLGKGLGNSVQKLGGIPESQNDMIFSIICEELGVFGAIMTVLMISYLLYLIMKVAMNAESLFGFVLAFGVFLHISVQAIINIAVNCNFFPNTGLPLPFISAGGTSVFCMLMEVAMVLTVSRKHLARNVKREYEREGKTL
ncbi:MAG: cell division protein FtsW [Ruminococcus sp.]|nr:cell division protein FtsW [Ruminococcus sp.]